MTLWSLVGFGSAEAAACACTSVFYFSVAYPLMEGCLLHPFSFSLLGNLEILQAGMNLGFDLGEP